jgi:hypothetical protein
MCVCEPLIKWALWSLSLGVKWQGVELTPHLQLVTRTRKHISTPPCLHGVIIKVLSTGKSLSSRCSIVGWGTVLQAGTSLVALRSIQPLGLKGGRQARKADVGGKFLKMHFGGSRNGRYIAFKSRYMPPDSSGRTMALRLTETLTEMSTKNIFGAEVRSEHKADNLTISMKPIVYTMRDPRPVNGIVLLYTSTDFISVSSCIPPNSALSLR